MGVGYGCTEQIMGATGTTNGVKNGLGGRQLLHPASEVSYLIPSLSGASELQESLSQGRYRVENMHFCLL